ncbi:MAG TPA: DUF927 domain-containing protein [Bryobacteraceae bacterium]|nr:DUF927 domain-containing protein [Bryobacteraceae bacterium]
MSATDTEKGSARLVMERVRSHFAGLGWPRPIIADSGSGFHVLYAVDLPNDAPSRQLLKSATARAAAIFTTPEVKLDVSVSNPARIIRLWGTVNRKGTHTPERPWRRSALLEVPERVLLTVAQLAAFIGGDTPDVDNNTMGAVPAEPPSDAQVQAQPLEWRGDGGVRFDMPAFLAAAHIQARGPEPYNGGERWILNPCPFNPEHNRGEVAVFVDELGRPGFQCFHESCSEYKGWDAFEKKLKAQLREDAAALSAIAATETRQGYSNTAADGLYRVTRGGRTRLRLGGMLNITARVRNAESLGWGWGLSWIAPDRRRKELVVSSAELATDPRVVLGKLCDEGYDLAAGNGVQDALIAYIRGATPPVELRVDRPGWHGGAFVLPDEVIRAQGAEGSTAQQEKIHLASASSVEAAYNVAGTLDDWKSGISQHCVGNSRLILAVCAGFAGTLLRQTGNETGGVHLCGASSVGKSTALAVAASVCGGGGSGGYVRQWRATANGLEGVAVAHNDSLLALDELGQIGGREVAAAIYMLANASGKARARKDGSAAPTKTWAAMLLSSGELSLSAHANEAGAKVKAGAEVRLLTIPADAGRGLGLYEDIHGFGSAAEFSDHLKSRSRAIYGTPLRAFLRWFVSHREYALRRVVELQDVFSDTHLPTGASGEIVRAAGRFSLLSAAGELATEAGVTDWAPGVATEAAGVCFADWLAERGSVTGGDVEAGVRQVLAFIEEHGARFQDVTRTFDTQQRVGFMQVGGGTTEYLILRAAFEEILTKGHNYRTVRTELIRRGLMIPGEDANRPGQQRFVLPRLGRTRCYVMRREDDTFVADALVGSLGVAASAVQ